MFPAIRRIICTKTTTIILEILNTNYSKTQGLSLLLRNSTFTEPHCNNIFQQKLLQCRHKSKNKSTSKKEQTETETEDSEKDFLDDIQDKNTKTQKVNVSSMRLDVILKVALGLSRNKLETLFYESRIRLNGEKVLKKSVHIKEGDEIDVIKGCNVNNKDFLTVARVELLSAIGKDESINVKLRKIKSLTVDNYEGNNRWEE